MFVRVSVFQTYLQTGIGKLYYMAPVGTTSPKLSVGNKVFVQQSFIKLDQN